MYALIITALAGLPIFPLNPTQNDSVSTMNVHFTAGVVSPSELISAGPELTVKYELLFSHPFIIRTGLDYRFGRMSQLKYPKGGYHGFTFSAECLHYRGSHKMKGFAGAGVVYNYSRVSPDNPEFDSIMVLQQIDNVRIDKRLGYRIIFGVRRSDLWSIELRVTDIRTNLVYERDLAPNRYSLQRQKIKLSDIRFTVGYLLPLR